MSALLSMHSRQPDAKAAAEHLMLAANRVAAVARVHRHFYTEPAEAVSCLDFIRRLCADLATMLERPVHVHGDDVKVATTSISPSASS